MNDPLVTVSVKATWDDGTILRGSFDVEAEHDASGRALACVVALEGAPNDAGALARLRAAITAAADVVLADATITGDLDAAIGRLANQLMHRDKAPTPAQTNKWKRFQGRPDVAEAGKALHTYLALASDALPRSALGTHWGITVMVEAATLRVNVGDVEVLAVRGDGKVFVGCQGERPAALPPYGIRFGPGQKKAQPNHTLAADSVRFDEAINDRALRAAVVDRIHAVWRTLPKANYHNPLAEVLLDPV